MKKYILTHIENNLIFYEAGGDLTPLVPSQMSDFFSTLILNVKEQSILWVFDLDLYGPDFIKILFAMGFIDQTPDKTPVKNMGRRAFKYCISDKQCFYYIIVRVQKKTLYIYNANNILANIDQDEILNAWGDGRRSLKALALATYKGVDALRGFQSKKTPYTLNMVASREWKKREELYNCENLINCKNYPAPDGTRLDKYIRQSYNAGWNFLNPQKRKAYKGKTINIYDVNSLYPYIAATKPLPWGAPMPFKGKPPEEYTGEEYYYYIRVKIQFDLKRGSFPYIQKRGDFRYKFVDYLKTSDIISWTRTGRERRAHFITNLNGEREEVFPEFVFSRTDWELIRRHYDIKKCEYIDGVAFRTCRHVFNDYVSYYYSQKLEAARERDPGKKRVAKMMLNSVIGGLAKRAERTNIIYYFSGKSLEPHLLREVNPSPSYIHIASAILSYAREYTYEAACANFKTFLYSDTDSIHVMGEAAGIEINPEKLGAWKLEHKCDDAFYMKRKSYIIKEAGVYAVTMAGVSYDFQLLINDVLNGNNEDELERRAEAGAYGSARTIFKTRPIWIEDQSEEAQIWKQWGIDPDEEQINDYGKDYEELQKFIENIESARDKITALLYENYPTGVNSCEDFNIKTLVLWLSLQSRQELRGAL